MKKLANETVSVHAKFPKALYERLVRQAAKETADRAHRVTPSDIVRWAVEDYLNDWEGATFVPDQKGS